MCSGLTEGVGTATADSLFTLPRKKVHFGSIHHCVMLGARRRPPPPEVVGGRTGRIYTNVYRPYTNEQPRRIALWVVESIVFEAFVTLTIVANCITMALSVPGTVSERLDAFDSAFLCIFTAELLPRLIAYGPHSNTGGFFSDEWAMFEAAIVVISWIEPRVHWLLHDPY